MRNGFLVTSHRKKLWNVQIGLINEFARICKKYNLRWFACGGTLLGAARHKGFIPWDDDVDVAMLRPDYNQFLRVAAEEIKYPYFCDNWYEYTIESEHTDENKDLQYITVEQEINAPYRWFTQWPSIRLRDSRTTLIEFPDRKTIHQGIFIDIFPYDIMPPFTEDKQKLDFAIACELMVATAIPRQMRALLKTDSELLIRDELEEFLNSSYRQRGLYFDYFAEKIFFRSEKVGDMRNFGIEKGFSYNTETFDNLINLPFENITIPAPANFDYCLKTQYGDWHKPIYTHNHSAEYSADIPYTEYYVRTALMG